MNSNLKNTKTGHYLDFNLPSRQHLTRVPTILIIIHGGSCLQIGPILVPTFTYMGRHQISENGKDLVRIITCGIFHGKWVSVVSTRQHLKEFQGIAGIYLIKGIFWSKL